MNKLHVGVLLSCLLVLGLDVRAKDLEIKPYGYIKLDASLDEHETSHGNFVMWVNPVTNGDTTVGQYNMTANETRLGAWISKDYDSDIKARGRVEVDFYGAAASENKSHLMLRHAYIEGSRGNLRFLFGQSSDIISPLVATTLNYSVLWGCGNIGYRRPQVRAEYTCMDMFDIAVAGMRGIGDDLAALDPADPTADGTDDAVTSRTPQAQGRLGVSLPIGSKKLKVGVSGHYGNLEAYNNTGTASTKYKTRSYNADIYVPLQSFLLKGEAFSGMNLRSLLGSILNDDTIDGVESDGGWFDLSYSGIPKLKLVSGFGVENVRKDDVVAGSRQANQCMFANAQFTADHGIMYGVEVSQWETTYKDSPHSAKSNRAQFSAKYSF